MNGAETIAETPLLGEAALQEAFAELGRTPAGSPANGSRTAAGHTQSPAEPPKTVAQVLGEIAWLMTQSPRHKAIPLHPYDKLDITQGADGKVTTTARVAPPCFAAERR